MAVILKNVTPPYGEVIDLCGASTLKVYKFLWESAEKDVRYDKRTHLPWNKRRDCGGTTSWSTKGIADSIGMSRNTVAKAIDKLLDNGFLSINAHIPSGHGKYHRVYQVNHPDELEGVRYAISMFGEPPSMRFKNWSKPCLSFDYKYYDQMKVWWSEECEPSDMKFDSYEDRLDYLCEVC